MSQKITLHTLPNFVYTQVKMQPKPTLIPSKNFKIIDPWSPNL